YENRSAAQWALQTPEPRLGGGPLCRSTEDGAGVDHALLQTGAAGPGKPDVVPFRAAGLAGSTTFRRHGRVPTLGGGAIGRSRPCPSGKHRHFPKPVAAAPQPYHSARLPQSARFDWFICRIL